MSPTARSNSPSNWPTARRARRKLPAPTCRRSRADPPGSDGEGALALATSWQTQLRRTLSCMRLASRLVPSWARSGIAFATIYSHEAAERDHMSTHHTLRAAVGTVHRGVFDAAIAPVLTIASGDVVEVTTLSGNPDQMPPPELGFTILPEHREVLARVPKGEGPHFMTGPIAVDGAMPGDELIVEVLAMELAQDWGWNRFAPGMGTLPEQFPDARCIHIGNRSRRRYGHVAMGIEAEGGAVFRDHRGGAAGGDEPGDVGHSAGLRRQYRQQAFWRRRDRAFAGVQSGWIAVGRRWPRTAGRWRSLRHRDRDSARRHAAGHAGQKHRHHAGPGRRRPRTSSPWRSIPISMSRRPRRCGR